MDIVLNSKDNLADLSYKGLAITDQPHRLWELSDGRVVIQVGDMNKTAKDKSYA